MDPSKLGNSMKIEHHNKFLVCSKEDLIRKSHIDLLSFD